MNNKAKLVIEKVFEEEATKFEVPVYLLGYDPYSNQNFKGKFLVSDGKVTPIAYQTDNQKHLSSKYSTDAAAMLRSFMDARFNL